MSSESNNVPLTEEAKQAILDDFASYIASYNAEDLQGVAQHLDEDLTVLLENQKVAQGKSNILQSYPPDFALHKRVQVTRQPVLVVPPVSGDKPDNTPRNDENDECDNNGIAVDVELTARVPGEDLVTTLDVLYVYRQSPRLQQVCHIISNVRQIKLERR